VQRLSLDWSIRLTIGLISALSAAVTAVGETNAIVDGWSWGPLLSQRRTAFGCCATKDSIVTVGGTFWSANDSGVAEKQWVARVDSLLPSAMHWQSLPEYPIPIDYALVVYLNGRIYVIGGQNDHGLIADTYSLAPQERPLHWRQGPRLPRPLSRLRGGTWGSMIVVVTDEYSTTDSGASRAGPKVIAWDTDDRDGGWTELAPVPEPSIGFRAAAVAGDNLFVFGGASELSKEQLRLTDQVWQYSLKAKQWSARSRLPTAMRDTTAVAVDERYILLAGGVEQAVAPESAPDHESRILLSTRCLVYDTIGDRFMAARPLRLATADHGIAVLGTQLFVVGGEDSPYRTRTDLVQFCDVRPLIDAAITSSRPSSGATTRKNALLERKSSTELVPQ
jgi:hypothetical protein